MSFPHPRHSALLYGHHEASRDFLASLAAGTLHHAWLLSGPKGIGKATFAYHCIQRIFARHSESQLCDALSLTPHPLSRIRKRIEEGSWLDLMVMERQEKKEIGVDQVRDIAHFLHLTPAESPYRVVLIDSADDMNPNAANALLKLLEEPPLGAYLFLISHRPGKLLATLRSRCKQVKFSAPGLEDSKRIIANHLPELPINEQEDLLTLAHFAPGRALDFAQMELAEKHHFLCQMLTLGLDNAALQSFTSFASQSPDHWDACMYCWQRICHLATSYHTGSLAMSGATTVEQQYIPLIAAKRSLKEWLDIAERTLPLLRDTQHLNLDKNHAWQLVCGDL